MAFHVAWQWETLGGRSRTGGNTGQDALVDSSLSIAELVAREIPQNFDDAADIYRKPEHRGVHRPTITFRFNEVTDTEKQRLMTLLDLKNLVPHAKRVDDPRTDMDMVADTCLADLDDPDVPLRLLYIEEHGTVGLVGDPVAHPDKSRWYNALESQGLSYHDDSDTQSGGTFGFGKAAFQLGSLLSMVVAYSRFEATKLDPVTRRLGGYLYTRHHRVTDEGKYFTGFASFGNAFQDQTEVTYPYVDEDADRIAADLGMGREDTDDINTYGTTFLLVDPAVTADELSLALEWNWWPALIKGAVEMNVVDYDGTEKPPRPKSNLDLRPYLECWSYVTGISQPPDDYAKAVSFYAIQVDGASLRPGKVALIADPDTCFERDLGNGEERASQIALVRQRLMVVKYQRLLPDRPPFVNGVLFADEDVEVHLAKAEPKTHDRWWLDKPERVKNEWPDDRKKVVKELYERTYRELSKFRTSLRVSTDEDVLRLNRLSRMLGNLLRTRGSRGIPPPPPPKGTAPVSLSIPQRRIVKDTDANGRLRYSVPVSVSLSPEAQFDSVPAEVQVTFTILEDTGRHGDSAGVHYSGLPKGWTADGDVLHGTLSKKSVKFTAASGRIDGPFVVEVNGTVRLTVPSATSAAANSDDAADQA